MKSFDDFLSTMSDDQLRKTLVDTLVGTNNTNPTFSQKELNLAISVSNAVSVVFLDILRNYHEWLKNDLEN